jgi:hypothetical protein
MRLAIICGGRASADIEHNSKPLKYIGNSIKKVKSTLENNNWTCKENYLSKDIDIDNLDNFLLGLKEILKAQEVDEFLFYYTGHGKYGNSKSQVDFQLRLESEQITIGQLVESINLAFENKTSPKMALVIDSCYSGEVVSEQKPYLDIEILTSTDDSTKSFEKQGLVNTNPNYGISVFSHYFCNTFETIQKVDEICLKTIGKHVASCQSEQEPYYNDVQLDERMVIGYNKKLTNLKTKIKQYYQKQELNKEKQVDTFKYDILRFYPRAKEEIYKGIRRSKSMDDLLDVLFADRSSSYLYCILKFLEIEDEYIDTFKGDKECIEVNVKVEGVIVVVEANTNNDTYRAEIYRVLDNGKVEESGEIAETTWKNLYKKELVIELEKILSMNCVPKLELQMVLPIKLMKSQFKKEDISVYIIEDIFDDVKWEEKFNITTKFLSRLKGYGSEDDNFFSLWSDNLTRYSQRLEETIDANVYCPKVVEKVSNFCDNNALFLVSENSLVDDINLAKLYSLGIPFMITTEKDKYAFTSDDEYKTWKEAKVKNIRNSSYIFINEMPETLHFLCDDGYSNEFLEVFQKMGNDELETENFIGEDDYE